MKHILYFVPRESISSFTIELTNKLTKEVIVPEFEWAYEGSFIKITFAESYKDIYSMQAYTLEEIIYKGSFSNDIVKTEIINDKIYL